ncbi:TetR family transcriptional regulator [Paenibacillus baekrokdamisoli]|uniref:TetR family transcriptional regulator n=1 Tax=Paenibacillus baekrokdamisoli TaxID=1712516 RepID=A0A3G9J603_9BACL|nr:TetR/AcrR family transcriptional regulator [Paenibacillus baekrokdamisoli]MBB3068888.1 AcrR family transcriptional regulator [Paenibacillus baekrokdamisoli]BBH23715.1 TetR family transcriptional regulator [Paenibacillus baekrokdamisoli]
MVQILKDEIRYAILRAAQDAFMQHGYSGTSIKQIAEAVGISAGNLYRYYAGKEEIFEAVVGPVYQELQQMLGHNEQESTAEIRGLHIGVLVDMIIQAFGGLTVKYRVPLLILVDGSKGTRHENERQTLYKIFADHIVGHFAEYNHRAKLQYESNLLTQADPAISLEEPIYFTEKAAWPISVAFFQGYLEIVRRYEDPEECHGVLRQYVALWYQGLQSLI